MKKKECFKCKKVKPLSEFYKHSQMADGYLNKCKECTKVDVKLRRMENIDYVRTYDLVRNKTEHRKQKAIEYQRSRRENYPEKYKARTAVSNALRDGRIEKCNCQICGGVSTQAHHNDYSRPLDIIWVCDMCHDLIHGRRTEVFRKAQ